MLYHVDGDLVEAENATVSATDRGFQYGDAAFETLRVYGGTVFEWARHRERLEATCETLGMPGAVPEDLLDRILATVAENDLTDAYVRASVTRGEQPGKLTPQPDVDPTVVVVVKRLPRAGVDGEPVWDGHATVLTADTRKIPDSAVPADAKTHNYLNGILARLELRRSGVQAHESLMLAPDGSVAEGATSNLFFVRDGNLHTPNLEGPILPGVTRRVVLDIAEEAGIPVRTGTYDPSTVRGADEAFLTNTTWELRPIATLDGTDIGAGPLTRSLRERFDRRVEALY